MATVQDWVDDLSVEVPSCLEITVARAVKFSIQEFFGRSEAWSYEAPLLLKMGILEYTLPIPDETYILANKYVTTKYQGYTESLISTLKKDLDLNAKGTPSSFASDGSTMFVDSVKSDTKCLVGFTLKPTRNIDIVPDAIADRYFETIRHGALFRLKSMIGKDYFDMKGAQQHEIFFEKGIALSVRESKKLRSRVRRPAKFNKGFAW